MNSTYKKAAHAFAALMPFCTSAYADAPTAAGSGLQVLFGMVVVLGLLMGIAWWLKRFGPVRTPGGAAAKIVGGISVGARERVVVIEVGDQWVVVGVAPGSVNALTTLPRQEFVPPANTADQNPANFSSWLKQTIDRRNGKH